MGLAVHLQSELPFGIQVREPLLRKHLPTKWASGGVSIPGLFCGALENSLLCYVESSRVLYPETGQHKARPCSGMCQRFQTTSCPPNGVDEYWNRRETKTLEIII